MKLESAEPGSASAAIAPPRTRGRLFRKYVALFVTVVCAALVVNGLLDIWISFREQKGLLIRIQHEQAEATATQISQFIRGIEAQLGWATQLPWSAVTLEDWRFDAVRLMRQVPAITELQEIDPTGHEQARMSRLAPDEIGSGADRSQDPAFVGAVANKIYYGPVYFRRESEPYMTIAIAGARRDYGVVVAQVNLKFIWDVVSQIKVGKRGQASVVDAQGRLIAHPDISLVLRNTDLSRSAGFRAARSSGAVVAPEDQPAVTDALGRQVLSVHAEVAPLDWLVFVELPVDEAYAPLYESILRAGALLAAALVLAVFAGLFLARRMMVPINALRFGAARIGHGDLAHRISIRSGDELEALGDQFNSMAEQLGDSYATLERKVEQRTHQLELANLAKTRFLAAASHDLRQPLHALGLFVAQLRDHVSAVVGTRIVDRIDSALAAMNELFNSLLDMSRLDAGVLTTHVSDFPIDRLLKRIQATFTGPAQEKGLSLQVVGCGAWVRSDFILLERILLNLASNAVRYTSQGGVVIGCRRRGGQLRIEVWDSGLGIAEDQRGRIFDEFYQLEDGRRHPGGLGLGLAIVERLCRLLGHAIEVCSTLGRGSRFTVVVPQASPQAETVEPSIPALQLSRDKLVAIIDDDQLVLDAMSGLLRRWGCRVVTAASGDAAIAGLGQQAPDLIVSDYRLADGRTGIEVIERLRSAFSAAIPAFLISGDTDPERLREARAKGYHLLHKPVDPMILRAMLNQMFKQEQASESGC
jgi:signal transduction histidine kinase/CheY-like chemotaxis protein